MLALGLTLPALAQPARPTPPIIRAFGEAVVSAPPDQAQIELGVIAEAATAQAAAEQSARQLEAVLARLRKLLANKAEISTAGYSLSPNYRHPREGGKPEIAGYTASHIVRVRTRELADLGPAIDAATQSGANAVHGLQFMLRDDEAVRSKALQEATRKARAHAEAMAAAAGLKILRVLALEQGEAPPIRPLRELTIARAELAAAPTPIEPGTIEVRASVTLTVEVAP